MSDEKLYRIVCAVILFFFGIFVMGLMVYSVGETVKTVEKYEQQCPPYWKCNGGSDTNADGCDKCYKN